MLGTAALSDSDQVESDHNARRDGLRGPTARFRPTSQDDLAPSGEVRRVRANLAALRALRTVQAERRPATPAEQVVLARWSGWGATARVFDENRADFAWARDELRELMSEAEVRAAARNTINAHYTDLALVRPVWDAVRELGFAGGQVLEPGCGSGNFLALAPDCAHLVGVELDPTSAAIAQALYPHARVLAESFADTRAAEGSVDLVVGNVPFGDIQLTDRRHNPNQHTIHNHFILKSLHLTKPGGGVAVLTSRYTLDAMNPGARREMAALADLVGAVRLPSGAHRRAAGTDAVIDLLMLRRREPDREPDGTAWERSVTVDVNGAQVPVSEYFLAHPDLVLGELRSNDGSGMYRRDDLAVIADDLTAVPDRFADALARIVAHARETGLTFSPSQAAETGPVVWVGADAARREGYLAALADGAFTRIESGHVVPHEVPVKHGPELRALLSLRDAVVALLETEAQVRDDTPELDRLRHQLTLRYDAYARQYGPINRFTWRRTGRTDPDTGEERMARVQPAVWRAFRSDPFAAAVAALEHFDPTTQTAGKADIFTQRVIAPRQPRLGADTPADALAICLDAHGKIRLDEIARLLGVDEDEARAQLGTLVFDQPPTDPSMTPESGVPQVDLATHDTIVMAGMNPADGAPAASSGTRLVPAADYLSGNVRAKLVAAKRAADYDPDRFQVNVDALTAVLPPPLEPEQIHAKLGAAWIDADDIQAFLHELLEDPTLVAEHPGGSVWTVRGNKHGLAATQVWGTEDAPATEIAQALLEQRPIMVYDVIEFADTKKRILNPDKTVEAQGKADAIAERFAEWVWENPQRAERLCARYNERFNAIVLRSYDDAELSLPGLALTFQPRSHQVAAVARMVNESAVLLAHEVGAGKTAEMAIGCVELRRLGLARKPCIVVPNNMLEQFAREFGQLYPRAKLLIATKEDFGGDKRRQFVARCATGDWDAVIMTRTAFERIPMSTQAQRAYLDKEVERFRAMLERARDTEQGFTVKRMEAALVRAEERLKKRLESTKDSGITFEQTGIDYLVVDEAHGYKNLRTPSNIPGAAIDGSNRASDLDMKLDYLRGKHGGRCATFATATPIANSVTEAYVMQRYLRPDLLEEAGITDFDVWAGTFGESVTTIEMSPAGDKFRMNTRFAKFRNVPELLRMWHVSADIKTGDDLHLPTPDLVPRPGDGKREPETVRVPASAELEEFIGELAERAEQIRNKRPRRLLRPDGHSVEDNMLVVSQDGRSAALDLRLIGRSTEAPTKLEAAAERIHQIWVQHRVDGYPGPDGTDHPVRGSLQIVFCDLGTPHPTRWNAYDELRDLLVARGLPRGLIRYLHEANTDQAKGELFAAARAGQVAVLLGSTEKMGVGTNVQLRAVALHHLDCPWRPADLQQREGRILRQGNHNPEVQILRYVTEGSFDGYSWQTVARKAEFIAQVMRGRLDVREIEDIGDAALSYNEVKAIATGNPLLLDQAEAKAEVTRLERLQRAHDRAQDRLDYTIRQAERTLPGMESYRDQVAAAVQARRNTRGDAFVITLNGNRLTSRADADDRLRDYLQTRAAGLRSEQRHLGQIATLGGLPVSVEVYQVGQHPAEASFTVGVEGNIVKIPLRGLASSKITTKLENALDRLDRLYTDALDQIDKTHAETERAHEQLGKPFAHADELGTARARLDSIETELAAHAVPDRSESTSPVASIPTANAPTPIPRSDTITFDSRQIAALQRFAATAGTDLTPTNHDAAPVTGSAAPAPVERNRTDRTLVLRHTYAGGTVLLGTDRGDHIAETFHAMSGSSPHPGGWKWSHRIDNGTPTPGAWYVPGTREHPGTRNTVDRITASARALRAAGFSVQVEIDDTALDPSGRRWLNVHAGTLGRSSHSDPDRSDTMVMNWSRDHAGRPADRAVDEVRARSANLVRQVFAATGTESAQPQTSANMASTTDARSEVDGEEVDPDAGPDL
ncbi:MAG TPA: DEAD/DEAH box helicase family protein [Pseudonocardiaceae bacterium]|nr:DEAD/DEAH box helicase family protein [Pseudonocardiaceae bacterium]